MGRRKPESIKNSMVTLFPFKKYSIQLQAAPSISLNKLKENTLKKDNLSTEPTNKKFIGRVGEDDFKIISSVIGKGAFCVLQGSIDVGTGTGTLSIGIHKAFRTLISVWCLLPLSFALFCLLKGHWTTAPTPLAIILFIRFIATEILFKTLSKISLDELVSVLGIAKVEEEGN